MHYNILPDIISGQKYNMQYEERSFKTTHLKISFHKLIIIIKYLLSLIKYLFLLIEYKDTVFNAHNL